MPTYIGEEGGRKAPKICLRNIGMVLLKIASIQNPYAGMAHSHESRLLGSDLRTIFIGIPSMQ